MVNRATVLTISAVLILLLVFLVTPLRSLVLQATVGETYTPQYPSATDKIFSERFGTLKCELTDAFTGIELGSFAQCNINLCGEDFKREFFNNKDGQGAYYNFLSCPAGSGTQGCNVIIDAVCKDSNFWDLQIKRGFGGQWNSLTNKEFTISDGTNEPYFLRCFEASKAFNEEFISNPIYRIRMPERAIFVDDPTGRIRSGRLQGSAPNCNLLSTDAKTLKNMQIVGDSQLQGITSIALGQTKSIVVGWEEEPAFGNINPLGQFNNQNVVCRSFDGIYSVERIATIGGIGYFAQRNKLVNLDTDRTSCCSQDTCGSGQFCEDYKCTSQPVVCEEGQCNFFQKGTTIALDEEIIINGQPFLRTQTCDQDACIHTTDTKVGCTKESCDRFDTPVDDFFCSADNSECVSLSIKQPCPIGQCCEKENPKFIQQSCPATKQCCIGLVNNDPSRGECADSCLGVVQEICNDLIDNDNDGLIDEVDPDCQFCIIDGITKSGLIPSQCCQEQGGRWIQRTTKEGGLLTIVFGIGGTEVSEQFCQKGDEFEFDTQLIVSVIIGLLAGLVIFLLLFKAFGEEKIGLIIVSIISILVAFVVGFLLIQFFTEIIVGAIVIVIFLFIVWIIIQVVSSKFL